MATTKAQKDKAKDASKETLAKLAKEVEISEAFVTAIFWNNPELYNFFPDEKINRKTFLNSDLGFFFGFGRRMFDKGVRIFDDVAVARFSQEDNVSKLLEKYGDFEKIAEIMEEVKGKEDNLDAYYDDLKKYAMVKNMYNLFGDKVLEQTEKYNYKTYSKEELFSHWNDIVNSVGMDGDNKIEEHSLLTGLKQSIKDWSENPAKGLPFYDSEMMTKICLGWDFGTLTIFGGFGGSGKTSMSFNKVIMSCIKEGEKLLILANEQSIDDFKKMLIVTAMGVGTKASFNRQRINEGEYSEDEFEKLNNAADWVMQLCGGDVDLIKFVFMENYVMSEVKKVIKHYASRGYHSIMIDTGKPSEGQNNLARWEVMTEDFKLLYKLARKNGNGLNLRMWVNVQLADSALSQRFLNEYSLGESKKIKNEADVVFLIRAMWADEHEGGDKQLEVYRWVKPDPNNPKHKKAIASGKKYVKKTIELDKEKTYYLLFTSKNRRGQDNKTGQQVLVLEPNFNSNSWKEVGWTTVIDDKSY